MHPRSLGVAFALFVALAALTAEPRLSVPTGHRNLVYDVRFSPDGRRALSADADGKLVLWDYASGREIASVTIAARLSRLWAPSPAFDRVYELDQTGKLRRFDLSTGAVDKTVELGYAGGAIAVSPDGTRLAVGSARPAGGPGVVAIHDAATLAELRRLEGRAPARFEADGSLMLVTNEGGLAIVDPATGGVSRRYPVGVMLDRDLAVVGPDGRAAAAPDEDGVTIGLWDLESSKKTRTLNPARGPGRRAMLSSLRYSSDGASLVSVSYDDRVKIWDAKTGALRLDFQPPCVPSSACFGPDGSTIVVGGMDRAIVVCDAKQGKVARVFSALESRSLVVDGTTGALLVRGYSGYGDSYAGFARLFDPASGKGRPSAFGSFPRIEATSPDGRWTLAASERGAAVLVDSADPTKAVILHPALEKQNVIALSPGAELGVVSPYGGKARVMELGTGKVAYALPFSGNGLDYARFSYDGTFFLYQDDEKTGVIAAVDAKTGVIRWSVEATPMSTCAVSPDSKRVLVDRNHSFMLRDAATGAVLREFTEPDVVGAVAFSPDGAKALSGNWDGSMRLYDLGSGRLERVIAGHAGWVSQAAFSPDARTIYSSSLDGTIRAWEAASGCELAKFFAFPDGSWATITPDGYFDADAAGATRVSVVENLELYSMDQFFERYRRPDIVAARLGFASEATARKEAFLGSFAPPPVVTLSIMTKGGSYAEADAVSALKNATLPGAKAAKSSAADEWAVEDGRLKVRVGARDAGGGLDGVALFSNGKALEDGTPVPSGASGGREFARDYVVELSGDTTLRAVAFSRERVESRPREAFVRYAPPKRGTRPVMWLVVAGADAYANPKYALNYAVADAKAFEAALAEPAGRLFARVETARLHDADLTREAFLAALEAVKAKAAPEDVVVFFYAGHGVAVESQGAPEFYFVMPDVTNMADPQKLAGQAISGRELRRAMAAIPAAKQLLVVDACNSGAFASGFARRGAVEDLALAQLSRSSGAAVISSTTDTQFASEVAQLGHGVFTYALLEGLAGKAAKEDGRITAGGLRDWVEDELPGLMKRYRGALQYPTAFIFGQDFPVGISK